MPKSKPYDAFDTELAGLLFRTQPSGRQSWYFAYRIAGVRRRFRIGSHPGVTCEAARRDATKLAGKIAANVDPRAERAQSRVRAERDRVGTLKAFLEEQFEPWALTHLKTVR